LRIFLLATTNPDKVREIRALMAGADVEIVGLDSLPPMDAPEETGTTFAENARLKARYYAKASGMAAIAEDSGLEIDALDGAPGVYAARYAGEGATYADNVDKALRELEGVAPLRRTARFATVVVARTPRGEELVVRGEVEGLIADAPRGTNGFGYDSIFEPLEGDGRTFAQMTADEKHALSHRGRALRALVARVKESEER
jgi:XTP/dITP diphosphohydrolase